jgi:hypothetical protein
MFYTFFEEYEISGLAILSPSGRVREGLDEKL